MKTLLRCLSLVYNIQDVSCLHSFVNSHMQCALGDFSRLYTICN